MYLLTALFPQTPDLHDRLYPKYPSGRVADIDHNINVKEWLMMDRLLIKRLCTKRERVYIRAH